MAALEIWLLDRSQYAAAFFAAAGLIWLASWNWRARAGSPANLDYFGDDDPVIRTLEVSR